MHQRGERFDPRTGRWHAAGDLFPEGELAPAEAPLPPAPRAEWREPYHVIVPPRRAKTADRVKMLLYWLFAQGLGAPALLENKVIGVLVGIGSLMLAGLVGVLSGHSERMHSRTHGFVDDPEEPETVPVLIRLRQGELVVGEDRGRLAILDGALAFSGRATSFLLAPRDCEAPGISDLPSAGLVRVGTTWIEVIPLGDATKCEDVKREWLRRVRARRSYDGPRELPPAARQPGYPASS